MPGLSVCGFLLATGALAQQAFPLPLPAGDTTPDEATAPFLLPLRMTQTKIVDRTTLLQTQSLPASFANWDMISADPSGRYLFVPTEMNTSAGLFRYDRQTGAVSVIMHGNGLTRTDAPQLWNANNDDFARLDPATWTPWGTVLTAEEAIGGRVFEVMNPLSGGPFVVRWLDSIPGTTHEGLRIDAAGVVYFVDEFVSGGIFRFVPSVPGDLTVGQTSVLRVDAWQSWPGVDAAQAWNAPVNASAPRLGAATWVPITDQNGVATTVSDPFVFVSASGARNAADEVNATPFGRPEDLDVTTLASGATRLVVSLTDEHAVLSIDMTGATTATVRHLVDGTTIDMATGAPIGAGFSFPDNVAVDAFGGIYVAEDNAPGDVFKVFDDDGDGVAERIGRIASLGVANAEPTGIGFLPNAPYSMLVVVMHPASGNQAIWSIDTRPYPGDGEPFLRCGVAVGNVATTSGPGEFVRDVQGGQPLEIAVTSAQGMLAGAPYALFLQPFITGLGMPSVLAPLWFDPSGFVIVASSGIVANSPGANSVTLPVPTGLGGISVMAQAAALAPGLLVLTDGTELVLR